MTPNVQSTSGSGDLVLSGISAGNLLTAVITGGGTPGFSAGSWDTTGTATNPSGMLAALYYCLSAPAGEVTVSLGSNGGAFQESSGGGGGTWALVDHDEVSTGFATDLTTKTFTFVGGKGNLLVATLAPYTFSELNYSPGAGMTMDEVVGSSGGYYCLTESGAIAGDAAVAFSWDGNSTGGLAGAQFTFTASAPPPGPVGTAVGRGNPTMWLAMGLVSH